MKHKICGLALICFAVSGILKAQGETDRYFKINKNIETFNSVVKELDLFYVDTVDVEKVVQTGITSMLSALDPYTNYITEKEMGDFKFMTTGEYAGIGSYVTARKIDDNYYVMITGPYEDKPASKAGLKDGDIILEIDGEDMTRLDKNEIKADESFATTLTSKVSSKLKGQAETILNIKIRRGGVKKPLDFKIKREQIHLSSVPYYDIVGQNTGYILLTGFTDKSALDVKSALLDLKARGITSLVIDLRGNSGGLLEEAVQIVNFFTPKGEVVLSTKGKLKQMDRIYRTTLAPIDTEIPLAILVDRGSASAAEIVSGAFQDLDRAVLVGERTFGKGLVQVPRELPYGESLKVTTSKYYIPSGRCIQAIDYTHRNEDGSVGRIPDSLTTVFKTAIGREVIDGGGVVPDVTLKDEKTPSLAYYLVTQYLVFDFATDWANKHPKIASAADFSISDADYLEFKKYVESKKDFKYDLLSEKSLNSLKEMMEYEGYMDAASDEFKALEAKLSPNLDRDLDVFKDDIQKFLNSEILKRYYYRKGEIIENLKSDKDLKKAIEILTDTNQYKEILSPKKSSSEETPIK